jgi:hypothetical protein
LGDIFAARGLYAHAVSEYEAGVLHSDTLADRFPELKALAGREMEPDQKTAAFQQLLADIREQTRTSDSPEETV